MDTAVQHQHSSRKNGGKGKRGNGGKKEGKGKKREK